MKAKATIPKKKPKPQFAEGCNVRSEFAGIADQLQKIQYELGGTIGTLLLLEHALISGDEGLTLKSETGSDINFSSISLASGEIIGTLASKIHVLTNKLDGLCFKLNKAVTIPRAA
jgi:hypothetical protein